MDGNSEQPRDVVSDGWHRFEELHEEFGSEAEYLVHVQGIRDHAIGLNSRPLPLYVGIALRRQGAKIFASKSAPVAPEPYKAPPWPEQRPPLAPATPIAPPPTPPISTAAMMDPQTRRTATIDAAWYCDPALRAEFAGNFATYKSFIRGVLAGRIRHRLPAALAASLAEIA